MKITHVKLSCSIGLRKIYKAFSERSNTLAERSTIMITKEEQHLTTTIRIFEDMLLRSKNYGEQEKLQVKLRKMRIRLQKMQWQRMGS
jgi:hypothetical protein